MNIWNFKTRKVEKEKPKLSEIAGEKEAFKINWKRYKEAYNTCELKGKESDDCKKILKEMNIDIIE